jgi:hypothetical protein
MQAIEVDNESYRSEIVDMKAAIETYRVHIYGSQTKTTEVYRAEKNDHIDVRLAEYINHYPGSLNLFQLFVRERHGVYTFGSKSICIMVENDNIQVRVGGGYLSIDEFIDQYAGIELEKLERKSMKKQFYSTSGSGKMAVDLSPNASRQESAIKSDFDNIYSDKGNQYYNTYKSTKSPARKKVVKH